MPYSIRKQNNKFKVINSSSGRTLGTTTSKDKANKMIRAININKKK